MTKLAEVHTLYESNARSVPDMLRMAADSISAETDDDDRTQAVVAIQLTESGEVMVYGWGDTNDLHAIGIMERGKHELLTNMPEGWTDD